MRFVKKCITPKHRWLFYFINNINTIYDRVVAAFPSPATVRPVLNSPYLSKIAIMNYIPVLVARDIPRMIYDNFAIYCPNIINNSSKTSTFLILLRDSELSPRNCIKIF